MPADDDPMGGPNVSAGSSRNVAVLVRSYALWNRDPAAVLELTEPHVEVRLSGVFADIPRSYSGRDGFFAFTRSVREVWEEFEAQPEEIVEVDGEHVLVRARFTGRGREGIVVDRTFGHLWTLHDGLISRLDSYASWEEAVEAAGSEG